MTATQTVLDMPTPTPKRDRERIADVVERAIGERISAAGTRIRPLIRAAAFAADISCATLTGPSRRKHLVRWRQAAMWIAFHGFGRSLPEIGREFGGRDHSTALLAVRRVEEMLADAQDGLDMADRIAAIAGALPRFERWRPPTPEPEPAAVLTVSVPLPELFRSHQAEEWGLSPAERRWFAENDARFRAGLMAAALAGAAPAQRDEVAA